MFENVANNQFMIRKRCFKDPQFIVRPVLRIALKQEETGSNKAIERARRLV